MSVLLISSANTASISCCICNEKRRLPHTRTHSIRMLTSMRLHLIRMLKSMRLHLIRMLPHIRLCLICILSYICHNAACNSLCICFPKSLSLSLCNYHCLRICHSDCLTLINHTKHSGSSEWHLIDQSAISTNYTDFQNRISFCSFAFNCYAMPFVLIENVEVLSTVNSKSCCPFSFSFHCLVISVSLNSTPLSKLKCTSCAVTIIKNCFPLLSIINQIILSCNWIHSLWTLPVAGKLGRISPLVGKVLLGATRARRVLLLVSSTQFVSDFQF